MGVNYLTLSKFELIGTTREALITWHGPRGLRQVKECKMILE